MVSEEVLEVLGPKMAIPRYSGLENGCQKIRRLEMSEYTHLDIILTGDKGAHLISRTLRIHSLDLCRTALLFHGARRYELYVFPLLLFLAFL